MSKTKIFSLATFFALPGLGFAAGQLTVTAVNKLPIARASQTLELSAAQLAPVGKNLDRIHVKDSAGNELIVQAVDSDYDKYHTPDMVIFQSDFGPSETRTFTVTQGAKQEYSKDQYKAFGRFVRERFDDFAWENDRIAHRTYGKALETWEGEPLCSSTIDIWSKRTSQLVINDWYLMDNYHEDIGIGADYYSAGTSRGDGGSGFWADNRLWVSRNFVESRSLANGPIRVMFELVYEPYSVNGISVSEVKRVTLDAGQQLDHYVSTYKPYLNPGKTMEFTAAIGLKKVRGEELELNATNGWLTAWENVEKNGGKQGLAIIMNPASFEKQTEDSQNVLMLTKVPENRVVSWWAGFCWDKAGKITTQDAWKKYVDEFAQGIASPIQVSVSGE
jgi:hypothetical protein